MILVPSEYILIFQGLKKKQTVVLHVVHVKLWRLSTTTCIRDYDSRRRSPVAALYPTVSAGEAQTVPESLCTLRQTQKFHPSL
jgi:hypothetical protein